MDSDSHEAVKQAKYNLENAVSELRRKHSFKNKSCILDFSGTKSPDSIINSFLRESNDILKEIEEEEKNCDRYLTLHCRDFIEALEKSQTSKWDDRNLPQGEEAQKQIRQSLQKIKDRSTWKSREISADFKSGLERRISDFPNMV